MGMYIVATTYNCDKCKNILNREPEAIRINKEKFDLCGACQYLTALRIKEPISYDEEEKIVVWREKIRKLEEEATRLSNMDYM